VQIENNKNAKYKAIGSMIFGGSQTLGHMETGWNIDRILEISDDMVNQNSYSFIKNYPDVPVVTPSTWENDEYLNNLQGKYDLFFANNPCSSLSRINIHAKTDGANNIHFYRVFNEINHIKPKVFNIENAPTLIKPVGMPILKDMLDKLPDYNFVILRDAAGNHGVAMRRLRTIVLGFRKDVFDNKIPIIPMNKQPKVTAKDVIGKYEKYKVGTKDVLNFDYPNNQKLPELSKYIYLIKPHETLIHAFCRQENWDKFSDEIPAKTKKALARVKDKIDRGVGYWDKSISKVEIDGQFPSATQMSEFGHYNQDRQLTTREMAAIMGYPDDFEFFDSGNNFNIAQTLAQGVPKNFVQYFSKELMNVLDGTNNNFIDNEDNSIRVSFQNHSKEFRKSYTYDEFKNTSELDVSKKDGIKLDK